MPAIEEITFTKEEANRFLKRKLLANSWHHFEEVNQGNLERECLEEVCSWEEAREVYETDVAGLNQFWAKYTGQSSNTSMDNPVGMILGILFGVIGFFIVILVVYILWKRKKGDLDKKMHENSQPYDPYPILRYYSQRRRGPPTSNNYETPLLENFDNELAMGLSKCYIERERLQLGNVITSGNFGDVWEGKLRLRDNSVQDVAVKSLKHLEEPEDVEKFLREGVMMRGLDHKHVLSLIGVCVDSDVDRCRTSPLIVLPFMKNGDLRTFLRDGNNVLTVLHLIKFCNQVALGMEYLASKKFVHRDLAARNCMVDGEWCVKVADFGLSRDLYDRDYYRSSVKTQLPLKWMPPESIKYGRYDEKTDVWSYGIVCWEIMTRGAIPYPTVQAVNILEYISEGKRMERPDCCPYRLYKTMKRCWHDDSDRRPTFEELVSSTNTVLQDARRSVKRKSEASESNSTSMGQKKSSNPYENASQEKGDGKEGTETRPKPKPRTSIKRKPEDRTDKHKQNGRDIKEGAESENRPATNTMNSHVDVEVGEYQETVDNRTTSV